MDRADAALGTPPGTVVLATSAGEHDAGYQPAIEDLLQTRNAALEEMRALVRSDVTVYDHPGGAGLLGRVDGLGWEPRPRRLRQRHRAPDNERAAAGAVSGQIGCRPDGTIPPAFEDQMTLALAALARELEAAGASLGTLLKTTVFLTDPADFAPMNALFAAQIPSPRPARSTIVTRLVLPELRFEIEAVAHRVHHGARRAATSRRS